MFAVEFGGVCAGEFCREGGGAARREFAAQQIKNRFGRKRRRAPSRRIRRQGKFAARGDFAIRKCRRYFAGRAFHNLFVRFCEFAADDDARVFAQRFGEARATVGGAARRFKQNNGAGIRRKFCEKLFPFTFRPRRKAEKVRGVFARARRAKRRSQSARAGQDGYRNPRFARAPGDSRARIADAGGAGVGKICGAKRISGEQCGDYFLRRRFFVLRARREYFFPGDTVRGEKFARDARVFGGDEIAIAQNIQRAQGNVAQVAEGRGDKV